MKLIHLGFIEVNVWKFEARNRRIYQREITMDYFFSLLYCENEISLVFKVFFMRHGFIIENAFRSCANFPSLLLYHIIIIILWNVKENLVIIRTCNRRYAPREEHQLSS